MAHLFAYGSLPEELNTRRGQALSQVKGAPEEFVLSVDEDAWADALIRRFGAEKPRLDPQRVRATPVEDVEIQQNPPGVVGGFIVQGGERYRTPGERIELHIPVEGEVDLLRLNLTNVRGLPRVRGTVTADAVIHSVTYKESERPDLRQEALRYARDIARHVQYLERFCDEHNERLANEVRAAVKERRRQVCERREWLESQDVPLVGDGPAGGPREISIERRTAPANRKGAPEGGVELVLADDDYEHILSVISGKARSMERMSGQYAEWDEPALRDDLIGVLNTHYPGAATGETFNKGGKTDILVRVEDVNAFIGECKKWKGAKALHEDDLPQLLRYRTWRDSKLALIYFCDRKDIHSVRDTVHAELPRVANFVRWIDEGEFGLRCELHPPDEPGSRMQLAVVFVDLST